MNVPEVTIERGEKKTMMKLDKIRMGLYGQSLTARPREGCKCAIRKIKRTVSIKMVMKCSKRDCSGMQGTEDSQ